MTKLFFKYRHTKTALMINIEQIDQRKSSRIKYIVRTKDKEVKCTSFAAAMNPYISIIPPTSDFEISVDPFEGNLNVNDFSIDYF